MEEEYEVKWSIDIRAESYEEAARIALAIQRDPESLATVFEVAKKKSARGWAQMVKPVEIDLGELDDKERQPKP